MSALYWQVALPHQKACLGEPHVSSMALPAATRQDCPQGVPLGPGGSIGQGDLVVPPNVLAGAPPYGLEEGERSADGG